VTLLARLDRLKVLHCAAGPFGLQTDYSGTDTYGWTQPGQTAAGQLESHANSFMHGDRTQAGTAGLPVTCVRQRLQQT
jgi:hypothetical protein